VVPSTVNYRPTEYDEFFSKIAKAVQVVGLEIRRTVDETKGTHVVGLVNAKVSHTSPSQADRSLDCVYRSIQKEIRLHSWRQACLRMK